MTPRALFFVSLATQLEGTPSDVYLIGEAISLIAKSYQANDDYFIRWSSGIFIQTLCAKNVFLDVCLAIALDLLDYDRDRSNLEAAALAMDAVGQVQEARALRDEAVTVTSRLMNEGDAARHQAFAAAVHAKLPDGPPAPDDLPHERKEKERQLRELFDATKGKK